MSILATAIESTLVMLNVSSLSPRAITKGIFERKVSDLRIYTATTNHRMSDQTPNLHIKISLNLS